MCHHGIHKPRHGKLRTFRISLSAIVLRKIRTYRLACQHAKQLHHVPDGRGAESSGVGLRTFRISLPAIVLRRIRTYRKLNAILMAALFEQRVLSSASTLALPQATSKGSNPPPPSNHTATATPSPTHPPPRSSAIRRFRISLNFNLLATSNNTNPAPTKTGQTLGQTLARLPPKHLPSKSSKSALDHHLLRSVRTHRRRRRALGLGGRAGGRRPPQVASQVWCCLRIPRISLYHCTPSNRSKRGVGTYCWVQRSAAGVRTTGGVNSQFFRGVGGMIDSNFSKQRQPISTQHVR